MKISLILNFIAVSLILCVKIYPQLDSFEKSYSELGGNITGYQIIQDGEDIISAGYQSGDLVLSKFTSDGHLIWSRSFKAAHTNSGIPKPLLKIGENEFRTLTTVRVDFERRMAVFAFNSNGDSLSTQIISGEFSESGNDILELNGSIYLICGKKASSSSFNRLKIVKLNPAGETIWIKEYSLSSASRVGFQTELFNDSQLAIAGDQDIIIINEEGDSLKTVSSQNDFSSMLVESSNFVLAGTGHVTKIDDVGNIIWQIQNEGSNNVLLINSEGNIVVFNSNGDENNLNIYNQSGNLLDNISVRGSINSFFETISGNHYAAGQLRSQLLLMKLTNNFDFTTLDLLSPDGGERWIYADDVYSLTWYQSNIDFIDLFYRTKSENIWNEIANNVDASANRYNWSIPAIQNDSAEIKIVSSSDPNYADSSKNYFEINVYDPAPGNDYYEYIAANNAKMWVSNNGDGSHNPGTGGSGFYWPIHEDPVLAAIFEDGLVFGGKINGEIYVNGNTHRQGLQAGYIMDNGIPADPNSPEFLVYKLKKDWQLLEPGELRDKYQYNFENWPGEHGAPYIDVNVNSEYDKGIDQPEIIGEETLFYVANDLDEERTAFTYGSDPLGLEFQTTFWAFNNGDFLDDVVFRRTIIINKGSETIEDMFIAHWVDDDMGNANDDYVGVDTALSLAFTWNADNEDEITWPSGYGTPPPAVGHMLLKGPQISQEKFDSLEFSDRWLSGTNMPSTTFTFYMGADLVYSDPSQGVHSGSVQLYNNMNGMAWNGNPFVDPNTGEPTKFCLPGDPVTGEGWYCGEGWPGGPMGRDMRYVLSAGPFEMMPGDTQEVVYATFMARGTDNINSVAVLRETAVKIHEWFGNSLVTDVEDENVNSVPSAFSLKHNYPNPFNPSTTIEYSIPYSESPSPGEPRPALSAGGFRGGLSTVKLVIYDVLGREVATLVNQKQKPGTYKVEWNASSRASGVYFYRLQAGSFVKTKKMILMK